MKIKNIFLGTILLSALTFTSCTEDTTGSSNSEVYTTASALTADEINANLKTDLAIEDIAILANDQFEAKVGASTSATVPPAAYTSLLPANATSTTADTDTGTPTAPTKTRTITITFGATADCIFRGHNIKGQMILAHVFTTSLTKDMTVAFNNFSIDGIAIESAGTALSTWQRINVSTPAPAHPKNTLTLKDVKFTRPNGVYLRNGWLAREWTAGYTTRLDLTDDVNLANEAFVTLDPSNLLVSNFTIAALNTPLGYKTSCSLGSAPMPYASSGTLFITKGSSHCAVIKFGTGACDNTAQIAIDMILRDHFTGNPGNPGNPVQYDANLYAYVPITSPPTTPPTYDELLAKFDAKYASMAVPFTLQ